MEVTFGVQTRDGAIRVQVPEDDVDSFKQRVDDAFKGGENQVLWVTDKDGREYGIPTDKIAFIEFGSEKVKTRVGFSSDD
jgi:hypothetical protein